MAKGSVTRRGSQDPMPEKNMWSHMMNALEHAVSGLKSKQRRDLHDMQQQMLGQRPPQTMVGEAMPHE